MLPAAQRSMLPAAQRRDGEIDLVSSHCIKLHEKN
jgi:hypothetical protein